MTYKTLHGKQPHYLHSMLGALLPSCSLRSNNDNSLSVPGVRIDTGERAFQSLAPLLCNNISLSVHSVISVATFKKHLKTHLFDLAFPPTETGMPHGLLMLRNCFLDLAVEHWFGCHATEPGFTRDIDALGIWLIDWLIDILSRGSSGMSYSAQQASFPSCRVLWVSSIVGRQAQTWSMKGRNLKWVISWLQLLSVLLQCQ